MSPVFKAVPTPAEDAVIERLDLILNVLALQVGQGQSVTERVRLLKLAGLDNKTIGQVLNTSTAVVRALASNLRTTSRKVKRK